ncbi:LCP family protein [Actinospica durhamensis]|uniref:LCP family protein n=1 Tax=Actinospica durhamensis TaxID=1508375 RepID=A0A941EX20_9ACTN|nr:LCP family protein [Actinospica durhamensis]MBR7835519.1 LCP family protein [Actinospica durhamensis]
MTYDQDPPRTRSRSAHPTPPVRHGHRAGRGGAAPDSGPGRVNADLDLDELDPDGHARERAARQAVRRGNPRRRKVVRIVASGTAVTMLVAAGFGYYVVHHLLGDIATVSLGELKNRPAPSKANALGEIPLNILVLGSQTRDGQTQAAHVGNASKDGTDLSDTAFLMHISADHKWAEIVSIPRDLFVPFPSCQDRTNPAVTHPPQSEQQFYNAMGEGGPACAVATVEQMSNIRIDHFVELTFDAFIDLTNAVGGVQVCVPSPGINDPNYSGLVLSAGMHTVTGNQALAFVRDRHGLATGEDTQRIRMQQMFMSSLFDKLTSNGTLEDPLTLYKIAQATTSNVTVDTALDNIGTMTSIAEAVGSINKKYIQYMTAPYKLDSPGEYSYDPDGDHSMPGPGFEEVWNLLRDDQPIPGSAAAVMEGTKAPSTSSTKVAAQPSASASPTVALSSLTVQVFNGTQIGGEAKNAAAYLKNLGMNTSIGYSGYSGYTATTVLYPAAQQAQAEALQRQIAGSVLKQSASVSQLTLVIGTNVPTAVVATQTSQSAGAGAASATPAATLTGVQTRDGDTNLCSNLPGVVSYGGHP